MSGTPIEPTGASIKALPDERLWRRFQVDLPAAPILAAREARLLEIAYNLARASPPGEVPSKVRRRFGGGVLSEILDRNIQEQAACIVSGLAERAIEPVLIEDVTFNETEGLRFHLRFEVFPNIVLSALEQWLPDEANVPQPPAIEVDDALKQLALQHGVWVALPTNAPAQHGDRVVCSIKAYVLEEAASPEAPPLIAPIETQSGRLPGDWWYALPEGVSLEVGEAGTHFGIRYLELHLIGRALACTQIAIRFAPVGKLARAEAKKIHVSLPVVVTGSDLTESASPMISLDQFDHAGMYVATSTSPLKDHAGLTLIRSQHECHFSLSDATRWIVPGLTIWINAELEIDCVIRLGVPTVSRSTVLRLPWPERDRIEERIVIGAQEVSNDISMGLIGAHAGEQREVVLELASETRACLSIVVNALYRRHAAAVDDDFAKLLGYTSISSLKAALQSDLAAMHLKRSRKEWQDRMVEHFAHTLDVPMPESLLALESGGKSLDEAARERARLALRRRLIRDALETNQLATKQVSA